MEEAGPKRPKKGGTWQRQQAESAENSAESALSILLMTYLAQGVLSGACVHAIAVAAKHDLSKAEQGYCLPKLDALAKLKHGKNLQQSVLNKLSQETNLPKQAEVDVPLAGGPSNVASSCIMLPHERFSAFFSDEAAWARSVLPEDRLEQFWDAFEHHPCMEGHPVKAVKDWKGRCCPLSLHGDEVPVQGVKAYPTAKFTFMASLRSLFRVKRPAFPAQCLCFGKSCSGPFNAYGTAPSRHAIGGASPFLVKALNGKRPGNGWLGSISDV